MGDELVDPTGRNSRKKSWNDRLDPQCLDRDGWPHRVKTERRNKGNGEEAET